MYKNVKMQILWPLLLLGHIIFPVKSTHEDLDYLRLLDDRLMYRIAYKNADEFPTELEESKEKLVQITSTDQEEYQCLIPAISTFSKKRIESYTGPSPAQLLQPIYDENVCSYKFEAYWNYELCHGRYVLQYHEEKENKKRTEYFLGNFVGVSAAVEARTFDQLSPPTKKIGDEMRAYYPVTYTHGTVCDITGKPRQTVVLYVCDEEAQQNIYSFAEVSSCHYEIIVLSSELCAHPAFQVIPHKEHEISCFPMNKNADEDPKPKALLRQEENEHQFVQEYALFKDTSSVRSAKQVFSKIFQIEEGVIDEGFNQLNAILESIKKVAQQQQRTGDGAGQTAKPIAGRTSLASKEQQQPPQQQAQQSPQSEMQKIVQQFWRGDVCLHGGTGWWKYEVCYGKTVNQYHHETGKPRQNILLGTFDSAVHKAWALEHPEKAVERKLDGRVMQVTNLYTQGDICGETNAHRSCEVRLRCRDDIAAQKVFIYMLEPATCQYIVVLDSPLFCEALQKVDRFGLFPEGTFEPMKADDGEKEETQKSSFENNEEEEGAETATTTTKTKKMRLVQFDLSNPEEIMRVLQNMMQGMEGGQVGQVVVDVTKIKIPLGDDDENGKQQESDENGQRESGNEEADVGEDDNSGDEKGKKTNAEHGEL